MFFKVQPRVAPLKKPEVPSQLLNHSLWEWPPALCILNKTSKVILNPWSSSGMTDIMFLFCSVVSTKIKQWKLQKKKKIAYDVALQEVLYDSSHRQKVEWWLSRQGREEWKAVVYCIKYLFLQSNYEDWIHNKENVINTTELYT